MTSVGIITFHNSINYGAVLQAYALQKTLNDMGHIAEIIDYCNSQRALSSLSSYYRVRHFMWQKVIKLLIVGTSREKRTEEFRRKNLKLSSRKYLDATTLKTEPPLYDAYISGSDQVWNPNIIDNDSSYFLNFAQKEKSRISYAASFGVSKIPDKYVKDYSKYIKNIDYLSTREIEGKQIIKNICNRCAEIVLDPTLLLNQEAWRQVAVPFESSKPYILCYYMPGDKEVNKSISNIAKKVSRSTGWKIINIGQKEYRRLNPVKRAVWHAGPAEFLGLFQNARFVVTNSFHGTAFSVIYKKPFLVPINRKIRIEKTLSSRITTLLRTLRLEHRLYQLGRNIYVDRSLEINYESVETILQYEKIKSINFLINALKKS